MKIIEGTRITSGWYISDQHGGEYIENAVYATKEEALAAAEALGPQPRRDVIVGNFAASGETQRIHAGVF